MVLRLFLYIWGSIILTVAAVVVIASQLNLRPPDLEQVRLFSPVADSLLRAAYQRGGEAAARQLLADSPDLAGLFRLEAEVAAQGCTGPQDLGLNDRGDCVHVVVARPRPGWLERLMPLLLPILAGLTISLPAGMLLARQFAAPLRLVGGGLSDLAQGNLNRRIGGLLRGRGAEIEALGQAFDQAAERLQGLSESRDRLFHDISHEIRSPLARLKAALGLLAVNPGRLVPMLARMGTDIDRMSQLLEELLTLARIDHMAPPAQEGLDLLDLLDPIIEDANFEGQEQGIGCHYAGPDRLLLRGDAELLHRAFENVIRNALKFTAPGTRIDVRAEQGEGKVLVWIEDRGSGADPDEIPALFQPFVRGRHAPERAGSGLGLAIAARAVALHRGEIAAANRPGGGLSVCISLPRGTDQPREKTPVAKP